MERLGYRENKEKTSLQEKREVRGHRLTSASVDQRQPIYDHLPPAHSEGEESKDQEQIWIKLTYSTWRIFFLIAYFAYILGIKMSFFFLSKTIVIINVMSSGHNYFDSLTF